MFTAMTIPMIPAIFNVKVKPNVKENILKFISVGAISSDVDLRKNSLTTPSGSKFANSPINEPTIAPKNIYKINI